MNNNNRTASQEALLENNFDNILSHKRGSEDNILNSMKMKNPAAITNQKKTKDVTINNSDDNTSHNASIISGDVRNKSVNSQTNAMGSIIAPNIAHETPPKLRNNKKNNQQLKADAAKQKIIHVNAQIQKQKEAKANHAAQKLLIKTEKIRNEGNTEEKKKFNQRYFHISIDKLADAFEKQFLNSLPDFGKYTVQDTAVSPETQKQREQQLGLTSPS